jgi:hypothetical protein
MKRFTIEGRNHRTYGGIVNSLFESRDFAPDCARASALQLDQPHFEGVRVRTLKPKCHCVNDSCTWRARLPFEEGYFPAFL